ncbi:hydroxymethylglutaryl-CoA lyase [Mumia zhuanghuii]|uniref:Hydroxymethylglutaryl-CoA lyase n=1 Tax=Mumia zhuanghuii TaxID=2585211 RepID=A0A5Q6RRR3_9ACTN|nr:hydroxymethylglutaryl-CoA lyase [Mumia zhuanghuii]
MEIVEVAPRDGLQNEKKILPTEVKADLVRRSLDAGLRRLEVTAFARPDRVPQMADAEDLMAQVRDDPRLTSIGLVLNRRGLDRAIDAGCDEVTVVVVASEGLALRNQGVGTAAQIEAWHAIAPVARAAGLGTSVVVAASFGCPFDGEVPSERVLEVVEGVLADAPDEIALADTIGVGVPAQVRELVTGVKALAPDVRLRAHFHNTRNTGYANALAAIESGVTVLDASTGGVGGCPFAPGATGNIATEDLLYLLHRSGYATGADPALIAATGTWLAGELGLAQAPAQIGRAGWFPA